MNVKVSTSQIRRFLADKGYRWRPRAQKRKYGKGARILRSAVASRYYLKSVKALAKHFVGAMDGVIVTVPPSDPVERQNYCLHGVTHM